MRFRLKLALSMLCLMSLLSGMSGSLLISISFANSFEREQLSAYNAYQSVLGVLQIVCSVKQPTDYHGIAEVLKQLPAQGTGQAAVKLYCSDETIYQDGAVLQVDLSEKAGAKAQNQTAFPMREADLQYASEKSTIRHVSAGDVHYLAVSGRLEVSGEELYLDIFYDITPIFEIRTEQLRVYGWVFLLCMLLCAFLSFVLSYALTRPMMKLSEASRDIASGQLFQRVQIYAEDEIGQVARDFNSMADTLEQTITELQDSVERQKRFTDSFAHEVKTPMTSIIGYADLIRGGTLDDEEKQQAAHFIYTEGRRLERLSHRLLRLHMLHNEEITFVAVNPAQLIETLFTEWKPVFASRGIKITREGENGSCYLEPELVKTLLINLLDNAGKAGATRIDVRSRIISEGCRITVQDDGHGISPEALSHLTEAFYRVDKSRSRALGGVGLGLSLCQEISDLHNGKIHFESEPGRGTVVTVDLKGEQA